ncbi:MAG: Protein of uncharacterized function [Firmicutes bacterium]|nr:Protein of uncharacterized function [Bacillota bacterium]
MKFMKIVVMVFVFAFQNSLVANAFVQTGHDRGERYEMEYPLIYTNNQGSQDAINLDICEYITNFQNDISTHPLRSGKISYELKYEDHDLISLILTSYYYNQGAAHGMHSQLGLVYDKNTGAKIPLQNYLQITPEKLVQMILNGKAEITKPQVKPSQLNFEHVKKVPESYFLSGNGSVSVIFGTYEVAPYVVGDVYVTIPQAVIDQIRQEGIRN